MPSRHEENIVEAKSPNYQYLNDKDTKELMKHYSSRQLGWCQVGEDKWFLPMAYARHGEGIFQAKVRSTDRWIVTFPRSGEYEMSKKKFKRITRLLNSQKIIEIKFHQDPLILK